MAEQPTVGTGSQDVTRLRRRFDGQVLLPDDGYHQARRSGTRLSIAGRRSPAARAPPTWRPRQLRRRAGSGNRRALRRSQCARPRCPRPG